MGPHKVKTAKENMESLRVLGALTVSVSSSPMMGVQQQDSALEITKGIVIHVKSDML